MDGARGRLTEQSLCDQKLRLLGTTPQDEESYRTLRPKAGTDSFMGSDGSWSDVDLGQKWDLTIVAHNYHVLTNVSLLLAPR